MRAPSLFIGFVVSGWVGGCASPEQSATQIVHDAASDDVEDASEPIDAHGAVHDLAQAKDLAQPLADLAQPIDMATPICNPASLGIGASDGQDICSYGDYCKASPDACVVAPVGSCGAVSGAPTWDTASKVAPVITSATATGLASTSSTTECAGGDPAALVTITYYAATPLSTSLSTLESEVRWKKSTSAAGSWYGGTFVRAFPSSGAHVGEVQIGMNCGASSGTLAVYLEDSGGHTSNVVCVTW